MNISQIISLCVLGFRVGGFGVHHLSFMASLSLSEQGTCLICKEDSAGKFIMGIPRVSTWSEWIILKPTKSS